MTADVTQYVETLARVRELFPSIDDERAFEIADRAHGRVVIDPQKLDAAVDAFKAARPEVHCDNARIGLLAALTAYFEK